MTGGTYVVEAGGKGMNPETEFTMDGGHVHRNRLRGGHRGAGSYR